MIYLTPEISLHLSKQNKQISIIKKEEGFVLSTSYDGNTIEQLINFDDKYFLFIPQENKIVYKNELQDAFNFGLLTLRAYKALLLTDYQKLGEQLLAANNLEWKYIEDNPKLNIQFLQMLGNGAWGGRICSNGFVFICPPDKRELICKS